MWTTKKLKERFFAFFEKRGHTCLPSSSVVPKDDPTLLFTNSGMVQFKNIFLGEKSKYKRVVTSQRCIRAGGKHNDLDDVGKDNYHHTFFEMLGNWSFGDYFKEEAIDFAYDFLINDLKLNKENMYVTVYDEMDTESRRIWGKYLDQSKILSASFKDNFWEMGEFGPCGPCTEIHYDRIGNRDASHLVNKDDPDVVEFWNIVFMEFERTPKGLTQLKIKNIDTGIGLERLLSILMGVKSNYLIDTFQDIIKFIETKCDYKYEDKDRITDVAFRVLADHSRTIAVCLNDKVAFSSEGVGYVLRRILRRAVRYANDNLKLEKGVLLQCVAKAAESLELKIDVSVVEEEENLFLKTLVKGLNQLMKIAESKGRIDGQDIFLLYDTYGFPVDLTELIVKEKNIPFSTDGFNECAMKAKELSKTSKTLITVNFDFQKTDDSFKYTVNEIEANLLAAVIKNEIVDEIPEDTVANLIFDKTCFYGESGGQVGDRGTIVFYDDNGKNTGLFIVTGTQIQRGYVLHEGILIRGKHSKKAKLFYDENLRLETSANHSATHILNHFLRKFIKTEQQGSLVDPEKLRFDFTSKKLTDDILCSLEDKMNAFIASNAIVTITVHSKDEILSDERIIKMENEEYPDQVRVITMDNGKEVLKEVCGGTHVSNTSEIELVRLISESGVKTNVRRIVALTREKALNVDKNAGMFKSLQEVGGIVKIDCQLSISQKKEIDSQNKENAKKMQKGLEASISTTKKEIEESFINSKLSNLGKKSLFSFECSLLSNFTKKEIGKSLEVLINSFKSSAFLFVQKDDDVLFIAKGESLDNVAKKIQENFPSSFARVFKDQLQGSIPKLSFSKESIIKFFQEE
ncbi:Alanine--tRNA ligase [Glugoides intestinalis]